MSTYVLTLLPQSYPNRWECSDFRGMGVPPVPFGTAKMAIPQEVLDYIHNRVELKIHKIRITLNRLAKHP